MLTPQKPTNLKKMHISNPRNLPSPFTLKLIHLKNPTNQSLLTYLNHLTLTLKDNSVTLPKRSTRLNNHEERKEQQKFTSNKKKTKLRKAKTIKRYMPKTKVANPIRKRKYNELKSDDKDTTS
jgi:hypothetical protein